MEKIGHQISLKIPEFIIEALIDMDEYASFCKFYRIYVKCHPISQVRKVSGTTLLNLYFKSKKL